MPDDLVPVCKDCGVVCQYIAAMGEWGLQCPTCGRQRVSHDGLEPTEAQAKYEAEQRAWYNRRDSRFGKPATPRAPRERRCKVVDCPRTANTGHRTCEVHVGADALTGQAPIANPKSEAAR